MTGVIEQEPLWRGGWGEKPRDYTGEPGVATSFLETRK